MQRCTLHPAYEADYCPRCGTAVVIAQTSEELQALVTEEEDQRWGYINGHFVIEDEALDIKFEEG